MNNSKTFLIMGITCLAPLLPREFAMGAAEACIGLALIFFVIDFKVEK